MLAAGSSIALGAVGHPCLTASTVLPFGVAVQKLLDEEFPDGQCYYTKEAHVSDLADEAIDTLVAFWKDMPMHGEVEIIGLGRATGDVPEDATAFSNRQYYSAPARAAASATFAALSAVVVSIGSAVTRSRK